MKKEAKDLKKGDTIKSGYVTFTIDAVYSETDKTITFIGTSHAMTIKRRDKTVLNRVQKYRETKNDHLYLRKSTKFEIL